MRIALSLVLAPLLLTGDRAASPINQVAVVATDYAFQVPAELRAGATAFRLTNNGKQFHEFNVTLLKRGVTMDEFIGALKKGQPVTPLREGSIGVLFADPGTSSPSQLTTQLLPGRDYAIICNFQDNPKAPQHYALGCTGLCMCVARRLLSEWRSRLRFEETDSLSIRLSRPITRFNTRTP